MYLLNNIQEENHLLWFIFTDYNYRTSLRQNHLRQVITNSENAESLWPVGVFLPPIDVNDLGYSWQEVQRDFPNFYKPLRKYIFSSIIVGW